ncbi:General transcription factor II-I repeat domain-containing protein 2A [Xyrichtys novacula]|uniref:General transcription factor II-I repeat domain-containing protein 2A n=1 Tax=Xyrichtys novacula TaxID=13765 RepID=A0AAV1FU58_XYRNO|nr:General transcription factor II-I repeat domain-containing protein 2A [Xyrichtys novacula]
MAGPRKKPKTYHFNTEWEEEFIFTMVKDKCVCLLCGQTQALAKKENLERHHTKTHLKFQDSYPPKSRLRAKKVEDLKLGLKTQQCLFSKPASLEKAATECSSSAKLGVWTTQLKNGRLVHFPNPEKMVQGLEDDKVFQPEWYCAHLDKLSTEFSRRFGELDDMGEVCTFVSNPFAPIDIEQVAAKMLKVFNLPNDSEIDMEIVEMQNDIELSARARDSDFWGLISRERFPLLSGCALRLSAYFGST